jgi:hypothetical protein
MNATSDVKNPDIRKEPRDLRGRDPSAPEMSNNGDLNPCALPCRRKMARP